MKTNGPYINPPALLLKNLAYSDMETRVNFKVVAAQPLGGLGTTLGHPHGLKPVGPIMRPPRMMAAISSAAVCCFSGL